MTRHRDGETAADSLVTEGAITSADPEARTPVGDRADAARAVSARVTGAGGAEVTGGVGTEDI